VNLLLNRYLKLKDELVLSNEKNNDMTTAERKAFKDKLQETIIEVQKDIVDLKELTKPIPPENAIGRVSRMDAINNKAVNEAALRRSNLKLNKLETALRKVDEPNFGTCAGCKRPIQPKRLMFMPESSRCVRCAR